jgi:hypothetical protein
MATELQELSDRIEECYEFTLSYAARGLAGDDGNDSTRQLREYLTRAAEAMHELEASCRETIVHEELESREKYAVFFTLIKRDAESAIAAIELVLAQPSIGSQLVDNLNASIHLRALLADLFLITEALDVKRAKAKAAANGAVGAR